MASRKLKYNGISQEELVACLKDIETALGGTNSNTAINIGTTYNAIELEQAYAASISASISAGSTWTQALSAAKSAGYDGPLTVILQGILSTAISAAVSAT